MQHLQYIYIFQITGKRNEWNEKGKKKKKFEKECRGPRIN